MLQGVASFHVGLVSEGDDLGSAKNLTALEDSLADDAPGWGADHDIYFRLASLNAGYFAGHLLEFEIAEEIAVDLSLVALLGKRVFGAIT